MEDRIINEYQDDYQLELSDSIDNQIINLNNLGSNYILDPDFVSNDIWVNILNHYNSSYGTIINLDYILLNQESTLKIGSFLYRFIVMDLIHYILPKTAKIAGLKDIRDLIFFPASQIKIHITNAVSSKISLLNSIKLQVSANINVYNELLKYTFYIDLIDSDFDVLFNKLLLPIIDRYEPDVNNSIKQEVLH